MATSIFSAQSTCLVAYSQPMSKVLHTKLQSFATLRPLIVTTLLKIESETLLFYSHNLINKTLLKKHNFFPFVHTHLHIETLDGIRLQTLAPLKL